MCLCVGERHVEDIDPPHKRIQSDVDQEGTLPNSSAGQHTAQLPRLKAAANGRDDSLHGAAVDQLRCLH